VNALPNITVASQTTCVGNATTLTATGASTFSWSTGSTTSSITENPGSTTTYTVTGTDGNGCQSVQTATITVVSSPTIVVNNPSICFGSSVTLIASGATTYSWNTGATTDSISVSPTSTTTYSVTGTATGGCSGNSTAVVTVNVLPAISASSNVPGDSICSGEQVILNGSGGLSYTWSGGVSDGVIFSPSTTQTYTVTGTDANGCTNSATINVVVNACLGMNANTIGGIILYPNPAKDVLTLDVGSWGGNKLLELFDVSGKLIRSLNSAQPKIYIETTTISQGTYFIRLSDNNQVEFMKFVVQH
jgi:hypothetical protein